MRSTSLLITLASSLAMVACAEPLQRLQYNNPGLVVDLGVGLWAWPLPMDFDGDGDLDLVVSCPDKPYNGTYFFENASPKGTKMPVFKPGKRISKGMTNARISYVNGKPIITTPGATYPDFKNTGFDKPEKLSVTANVHPNKVRANEWHFTDLDGDGVQDLVIGIEDWTNYGWDNAYDENGHWTNELLRGEVYVLKGLGKNEFDKPKHLGAGAVQINGFGMPSPCIADFDGDGDLDMICGEFIDGFHFYKNSGTKEKARFDKGIRLKHDGKFIHMDLEMITPTPIDWDGDGDIDLICGDEDGRVALIENTGKFVDGAPDFLPPVYFQQEAEDVKVGALCSPVVVDWDGDGDEDIITGSSAGYITFVENLSGPKVATPKWAAPKQLRVETVGRSRDVYGSIFKADTYPSTTLRIMAGPNGSIQGPAECKWGYTTLSVVDWDGDGRLDLVCNSIWGKVEWYRRVSTMEDTPGGPRTKVEPLLVEQAKPVEVNWTTPQPALAWGWQKPQGNALLTQWRTTPVAGDFNGNGMLDLVMLDHEGYLALFGDTRVRCQRPERGYEVIMQPVLQAPQRLLCDEKGNPLQFSTGFAGKSGRRKLTIFDWNGDGKLDILINSQNAELWQQVEQRDNKWLFKNVGNLSDTNLAGHDTSPTTTDFDGDGVRDLLLGAEDGRFYTLKNPRSK